MLSDVSVERTGGGALALFRLLGGYPPERLMVVSYPTANWRETITRLPAVEYRDLQYKIPRWIWNRFNPLWPVVMSCYIRIYRPAAIEAIGNFNPEAILTVAHGYLWILAASIAQTRQIPLHVICYDDWPHMQTQSQPMWARPFVRKICNDILRRVIGEAASRLCVSPSMAELYTRELGAQCELLYPSRGEESPKAKVRLPRPGRTTLVIAYAGMIHQAATADALAAVADVLRPLGGCLHIYSPDSADTMRQLGLNRPNIYHRGFLPSAGAMGEDVVKTADALILTASFEERNRRDVSTLFPSKMADYTAIGLPILIWGPSYSSAARWAIDNPGAAILVAANERDALRDAFLRLRDTEYVTSIAAAGMAAGSRDFGVDNVRQRFAAVILSPRRRGFSGGFCRKVSRGSY